MQGSVTHHNGRVRLWLGLTVLLLLGWAGEGVAQTVTLHARLIHASDRPAALDTRMDDIEYQLRRIFRFEHFAFLGETRTLITLPSESRIDLGHGYHLNVQASSRDGRVRAEIDWHKGDQRLLRTSIHQRRGVPAVLGGPPHDGGTLILVLGFQ